MKITKQQLRQIIKEALPPHLQKHFRKDGSSVYGPKIKDVTPAGYGPDNGNDGDRVEMKKLQTMLYRIEDDFLPFLMNSEEKEIGEAANQLYKLLKARVEG
jgi:hypothetical protein